MNNRHIENLTHRLLQALDGNYDVINMDAVLSVITALESTTITKEQLEATRLAKYINLFRRRTKSEQLAKRAKSLLKKWREMVGIQQTVVGPNATGMTDLQYPKSTSPLASSSNASGNLVNLVEKQTKWNVRDESSEPTSFINLIPNFSTNFLNHNSSTESPALNGPNARAGRKNRNTKNQQEIFNSDNFVNSNSMNVTTTTTMQPTIVIDIEDSNSGSNVIEKQDDVVIVGDLTKTSPEIKPIKHKKAKKEKKKTRNDRDMPNATTLVVIDADSSESQQLADRMMATTTSSVATEKTRDKSRNNTLLATNMSEILSLSNSSMSCIFPTSLAGETKIYGSQQAKAPFLSESELSFAGKFGGSGANNSTIKTTTCDSSAANAGPSSVSGDIFAYNENSNILSSGPIPKTSGKSRIFGGVSGYNSNDSVSNSHQSNFEIVENVCPGIPHTMANTVNVATDTVVPNPLEKMPKKRGRKKGSKGVDSLIAKDTSLSSQMLIQSLSGGNKKVKTTKELYAEMQNRKLGVSTPTTPSHWTSGNSQPVQSQQSRRDSFCSEPSLHSPRTFDACSTNATMSTIATSSTTPDKNASILRKGFDTSVVDVDSTSDSLISGGMSRGSVVFQESKTKALAAVEQQLVELLHKLPPVQSVSEIEENCASQIVPCTCKIIEIMPETTENAAEQVSAAMMGGDLLSLDKLKNSNSTEGKGEGEENEMPVITISVAGGNSGGDGGGSEGRQVAVSKEPVKPKKSIFDLDFDDDEDPLHTLIAEVAAANAVSVSEDILKAENDLSPAESKQESAQSQAIAEPPPPHLPPDQTGSNALVPSDVPAIAPMHLFPTYKVEEDEFCPAKERFELQTQQITGFHINALHNLFIPNVNGNWSDVSGIASFSGSTDEKQISFQVTDGLNVVPKISVEDHIRKDLREFRFRRKPKPRYTADIDSYYEMPFLGVARCLTKRHRKTRKHRQSQQLDDFRVKTSSNAAGELVKQEDTSYVEDIIIMEVEKENSDIKDVVKLKENEFHEPYSFAVSNQKPALEAITINVDNDDGINDDNGVNAMSSIDSQNLLAIASNIESLTTNETPQVKVIADDEQLAFPNISGDILNNNNNNNNKNSCSMKFVEEAEEQSSCESNTSLKQTQNSINQKLRKHRRRQRRQLELELEQSSPKLSTKRKRRRKKITPPLKIKCIKIAINGGITTQRHVKMQASSDSGSSSSEDNSNDENSTGGETETDPDEQEESGVSNDFINNDEAETACVEEEIDEELVHAADETKINDENEYDVACGDEEEYDIEDENGGEGDDADEDDGDDYIGEFHEVVTRDISPSTALGNNHIVLTIKKTPSKTNSPASNSPNVVNQITTVAAATTTPTSTANKKMEANDENMSENAALVSGEPCELKTPQNGSEVKRAKELLPRNLLAAAYAALIKDHNVRRRFRRRRRKRKSQDSLPFRYPYEVLKCSNANKTFNNKKHKQLFFPEEIYNTQVEAASSSKQCIFNISSCSSSCHESSEFEYESNSSDADMKKTQRSSSKKMENVEKSKPDMFITSSSNDSDTDSKENDARSPVILETETTTTTGNKTLEDLKNETTDDEEPISECNNGLLISFNAICSPEIDDHAKLSSSTTLKNQNFSPPRTDKKLSDLNPLPEFTTGIRTVSDDSTVSDSNNSSLSNKRIQQFKEWHQVLQLKSYNDELLTVLPYVVLD